MFNCSIVKSVVKRDRIFQSLYFSNYVLNAWGKNHIPNRWNNIRTFPFVSRARNMAEWMRTMGNDCANSTISCTFHTTDLGRHTRSQLHLFAPCNTVHFRESQRNPYLGLNIQRYIRAPPRFAFRFETCATKVNATSYLKFALELFQMVLTMVYHFVSSSLIKTSYWELVFCNFCFETFWKKMVKLQLITRICIKFIPFIK